MKRVFLIQNQFGYEDFAATVMLSEKEPTQKEALEYLVKKMNLEGFDIHEKNTSIEEYKDES